LGCAVAGAAADVDPGTDAAVHVVTTDADDGPGSLRAAIVAALASPGPDLIRFDASAEAFREPRRLALATPLPTIDSTIAIDGYFEDRLWQAAGVTLDGGDRHRIFDVAPQGRLTLKSLTLAHGTAPDGGAIRNRGVLELDGVTLIENRANGSGGAVLVAEGTLSMVNSTLAGNAASKGGAVAIEGGGARIVNTTFAANEAETGGAIANAGRLQLSNSILAGNPRGADCASSVPLNPASTNNLVQAQAGCGDPMLDGDPVFGRLGYYNGSTPTLPLETGSPAINAGSNAAAADAEGRPLEWDQRGNGDPRFVAGYTDLGAFEVQSVLDLTVDTPNDDARVRGCTGAVPDCSLRGALELANAISGPNEIRIGVDVHGTPLALRLTEALPPVAGTLKLVAPSPGCTILVPTLPKVALGGLLELDGVRFATPETAAQ
jgi:hypothetical protein